MNKQILFTITDEYAANYNLPSVYVGKDIVIYDDRYTHIEKHRYEFSTPTLLSQIFVDLPKIIEAPDYITLEGETLSIVKTYRDYILVAIRVSTSAELKVKTLYPINQSKYERLK